MLAITVRKTPSCSVCNLFSQTGKSDSSREIGLKEGRIGFPSHSALDGYSCLKHACWAKKISETLSQDHKHVKEASFISQ